MQQKNDPSQIQSQRQGLRWVPRCFKTCLHVSDEKWSLSQEGQWGPPWVTKNDYFRKKVGWGPLWVVKNDHFLLLKILLKKISFQGCFMFFFHVLFLVFMVLKGMFMVFFYVFIFFHGSFWLVVLGFHAWMTNNLSISSYFGQNCCRLLMWPLKTLGKEQKSI